MISEELLEEIIELSKNNKLIDKSLITRIIIDIICKSDEITQNSFNKIVFSKINWKNVLCTCNLNSGIIKVDYDKCGGIVKNLVRSDPKNVEYLEIPLYVTNYLFDLNLLFEKTPKLKKLIFYGININDDIDKKYKNMKILDEFNLNTKFVQKLRKINFLNSDKKSSFFIIKLIEIFLKSNIKENIKEIKIDNCDFDEKVNFNVLLKLISSFTNIKSLSLNNNSYEIGEQINYDEINNFNYLEKFYFKGLDYEKNEIKILYFLYKFSEKCRVLNELGFSCKGQNPYDMNIIFKVVKNYRLLTKLNIFDNYSKSDYYSDKEVLSYLSGINIGELNNYCLCDLRNIDLKKENKKNSSVNFNQYNKLIIKDYLHQNNNNLISNKKEKYYSYQNFFKSISFSNKLFYSGKEKSFIIGDINESLTLLKK